MLRATALLLLLSACSRLPHLAWPHPDDTASAVVTFAEREDDLCRHADDIRLTLLAPRVFGGMADPAAYDRRLDAIGAFCLTRPDLSAIGLAWLTGEVRTLHAIGVAEAAVLPPLP